MKAFVAKLSKTEQLIVGRMCGSVLGRKSLHEALEAPKACWVRD